MSFDIGSTLEHLREMNQIRFVHYIFLFINKFFVFLYIYASYNNYLYLEIDIKFP